MPPLETNPYAVPPTTLPPRRRNFGALLVVILLVFGLVAAIVLAMFAFIRAADYQSKLKTAIASGKQLGIEEQKVADTAQFNEILKLPYRTYEARAVFGGFVVSFPKNWSSYAEENESSSLQVNLMLNPDHVRKLSGDAVNNYATHLTLEQKLGDATKKAYDERVKAKKLTSQTVTVSGLSATRYEGKIDDKRDGVVVIIPIRDKTMSVICEDKKYLADYEKILVQLKLNP